MTWTDALWVVGGLAALALLPLLYRDHQLGIKEPPPFEEPPLPTSAPPATAVAYEAAFRQLEDQLKSLTDVDTKLGVAIGVLGILMAAFIGANPPIVVKGIVGPLLILALRDAYRGFRFANYRYAPGYKGPLAQAQTSANLVRWYGFLAMAEAFESNRHRHTLKGLFLNRSVATIAVIVTVAIVARVFSIA